MKCEEFRRLMSLSQGDESELEKHITECPACDAWLQKEIAAPPEGLTPAQWHNATARCFPAVLPAKTAPADAGDFWQYFANGLKYGLVLGLSLITGFAIIELFNPPVQNPREPATLMSFIDDNDMELPNFLENNIYDVTFYQADESKIESFLPKVQLPSFYEIDKEESVWKENQG